MVPNLLAKDTYLHEVLSTRLAALFGDLSQADDLVRVYFCADNKNQAQGIQFSLSSKLLGDEDRSPEVIFEGPRSKFIQSLKLQSETLATGMPVVLHGFDDDERVAIGVALSDHETSLMVIVVSSRLAMNLGRQALLIAVDELARKVEHVIADLEFEKGENLLDELSNLSSEFHAVTNLDELLDVASKKLNEVLSCDYAEVRLEFYGYPSKSRTINSAVTPPASDLESIDRLVEYCKNSADWIRIDDIAIESIESSLAHIPRHLLNLSFFGSLMIVGLDANLGSAAGAFVLASRNKFSYSQRMLAQLRRVAHQASSSLKRLHKDEKLQTNWDFSKELVGKTSLSNLFERTPSLLKKLSGANELVLLLEQDAFTEQPTHCNELTIVFVSNAEQYANADHWRMKLESLAVVGDALIDEVLVSDEVHVPLTGSYPLGLLILVKSDGGRFNDDVRFGLQGTYSHLGATLGLISARQLEYAKDRERKSQDAFFASVAVSISELVWAVDAKGTIIWASPNHEEFTGKSAESILGSEFGDVVRFYAGDDFSIESWYFRTDANILFEIDDKEGKTHILEAVTNELSEPASNGATMVISARDITDKIAMARDLEESESRYRSIVEASGQGILMLALDGTIQFANQAMGQLLGYAPSTMTGTFVGAYLDASSLAAAHMLFVEALNLVEVQRELLLCHSDGSIVHGLTKVSLIRDSASKPIARLAVIADISRHKAAEFELEAKLRRDPLTGLLNRSGAEKHFMEMLEELEPGMLVAMFFLDLDRFKLINDTKGHLIGDKLLISVAERLNVASRACDIVARLGGDEFLVVASDFHDAEAAENFGKRIAANFARPFVIDGEDYYTTASIGIATAPLGANWSELLRDADTAMYRAKDSRSSKVTSFDSSFRSQVERRMVIEGELRQAIVRNEMRMVFQPLIDIASGSIVGLESLMRWESAKLGTMGPNEFIPIAEDSGLIQPLGGFAINSSITSYRELMRHDPSLELFVAVNVSMRQLETSYRNSFMELIKSASLGPGRLILEVTESEMMRYPEDFGNLFHDLQNMGVRIGIDDFGTGYSSLSQLSALAPDIVKIDKHFISQLGTDQARQIVTAVVAMCDALGVYTVAEGVETSSQLEILASIGCHFAQGFYISRPIEVPQLPYELASLQGRLRESGRKFAW